MIIFLSFFIRSQYFLFHRPVGKVTFESIKSHGSTGSTGSKTSTASTGSEAEFSAAAAAAISASSLSAAAKIAAGNPRVVEKVFMYFAILLHPLP